MKITSCECYKKRFEDLTNSEIWITVYQKKYPQILKQFEDCYNINVVERGNGIIANYQDVRCCQFCGKKIEVEE